MSLSKISFVNFANLFSTLLPPVPDRLLGLAFRLALRGPAIKLDHLNWGEEDAQVWHLLRITCVLVVQDEHLTGKVMYMVYSLIHSLPPKTKLNPPTWAAQPTGSG